MMVFARRGSVDYVLNQVRPSQMAKMKAKTPGLVGIPVYFSLRPHQTEPEVWPNPKPGTEIIVKDDPR